MTREAETGPLLPNLFQTGHSHFSALLVHKASQLLSPHPVLFSLTSHSIWLGFNVDVGSHASLAVRVFRGCFFHLE